MKYTTPEMLKGQAETLRRDANLVADLVNNALVMDTQLRRESAVNAVAWFEDKYPGQRWQTWANEKDKSNGR